MLKITEVAKRLRISLACAYGLVESGKLACYRIGVGRGTIRVSEEQLQEFLGSVEQEPTDPPVAVKPMPPRLAKAFSFLPPPS